MTQGGTSRPLVAAAAEAEGGFPRPVRTGRWKGGRGKREATGPAMRGRARPAGPKRLRFHALSPRVAVLVALIAVVGAVVALLAVSARRFYLRSHGRRMREDVGTHPIAPAAVLLKRMIAAGGTLEPRAGPSPAATAAAHVPRRIWLYWHDPDRMPPIVQACVERIARTNPAHRITMLTDANWERHLSWLPRSLAHDRAFHDCRARFADLLRLHALLEHGGTWLDASVIMHRGLDQLRLDGEDTFASLRTAGEAGRLYGYRLRGATSDPRFPVVENWFLSAPPQHPFVEAWTREFARLREFRRASDYVAALEDGGVDLQNIKDRPYLAMHCAAQAVMQRTPGGRLRAWGLHRLPDAEDGPLQYLVQGGWRSRAAVRALVANEVGGPFGQDRTAIGAGTALTKMRGSERLAFEQLPEKTRRRFLESLGLRDRKEFAPKDFAPKGQGLGSGDR